MALAVLGLAAAARGNRTMMADASRKLMGVDGHLLRYHDRLLVRLVQGQCALASGRSDDAVREARTGVASASKGGYREFQWKLQALLGDALSEKGLHDEAGAASRAASDLIHQVSVELEDPLIREDYLKDRRRRQVALRASERGAPTPGPSSTSSSRLSVLAPGDAEAGMPGTIRQAAPERDGHESIIGRSAKMCELFAVLSRVARSTLPVLIRGERGTGKELVARAIHQGSARRNRRFVSENCAVLPDRLLEIELFGHTKRARGGADASRKGLFEIAAGGTLFLGEVGDMSMTLQGRLLRVLQRKEVRAIGSGTSRRIDVRVIAATSRDLEALIKRKKFRRELYGCLNAISVPLPALRDRRDDIPLLVDHFLGTIARENHTPKLRVDAALIAALARYEWPGNVRQLKNLVYRLALLATGDALTVSDAESDNEFLSMATQPGTGRVRVNRRPRGSKAGRPRPPAPRGAPST